jgi:hypothetical protein
MAIKIEDLVKEVADHLKMSAGKQTKQDYIIAFELQKMANDSADAKRYRELKSRYYGANFDIDEDGTTVLMFEIPSESRISADLDSTVDAIIGLQT